MLKYGFKNGNVEEAGSREEVCQVHDINDNDKCQAVMEERRMTTPLDTNISIITSRANLDQVSEKGELGFVPLVVMKTPVILNRKNYF